MIYIFLVLLASYIVLFLLSLKIKDNSIVDVFWGAGFIIIAVGEFLYFKSNNLHLIALLLILLWGIRLVYNIGSRKLKHPGEDPRYGLWRNEWKYFKTRSFFQVYLLQMFLMMLVSFPLYFIFIGELNYLLIIIGFIISIFGLSYEAIADFQLSQYIKNKPVKNIIFTGGLFKYSRHPNYFGEILFWLGITVISFSNSYYGIIGWLAITSLLLFVSGVPLKEQRYKLKDNYKTYSSETPLLIPNFFK